MVKTIQNVLIAQQNANRPSNSRSSSIRPIENFLGPHNTIGGRAIEQNASEIRRIRDEYYSPRPTGLTNPSTQNSIAGIGDGTTGTTGSLGTVDSIDYVANSVVNARGLVDYWPSTFSGSRGILSVQQTTVEPNSNLGSVLVDFFRNLTPDPVTFNGMDANVRRASGEILNILHSQQHLTSIQNISQQNLLILQSRAHILQNSYTSFPHDGFIVNNSATLYSGWSGLLQIFSRETLDALNRIFSSSSLFLHNLHGELFLCAWFSALLSPLLLGLVYAPNIMFNSVSILREQFRRALTFSINSLTRSFMFDSFQIAVSNARIRANEGLVGGNIQLNRELVNFQSSHSQEVRGFFSNSNWWRSFRSYTIWSVGGITTIGIIFQYRQFIGLTSNALLENIRRFGPTLNSSSTTLVALVEPITNTLNFEYWLKLINAIRVIQETFSD